MTLWFDDLTVGRSWNSSTRTVTEADVGDFATGDRNPLHTSAEYATRTVFGTRIADGLLGLTLAHGLMWTLTGEPDDSIPAFLGVKDWQFVGPIHFKDTVRAEYAVVAQRPSTTKAARGVVEFAVTVLNYDAVVQKGVQAMLIVKENQ
ncbi:MaoC/PaaZ C-terminal domain-containing protein [Rhodococcus sp. NPDC057014]|uniref:MaoC/PaaZ C-terminal domain-containing protein n=1 Tax=Rhodococcus sp. NPDC057014 TaxID=3346000 RepID=UPI00363D7545